MIVGLRALEKVELYEARHLVEMTISRQPDVLESRLSPPTVKADVFSPTFTGPILNGDCSFGLPDLRDISALGWQKQLNQLH